MFLVADDAVVVVKLSSFLCFSWFIWTSILCLRRRRFMHWVFQRRNQSDYESKDHELLKYGRCRHHGRLYLAVFRRFILKCKLQISDIVANCQVEGVRNQRSFNVQVKKFNPYPAMNDDSEWGSQWCRVRDAQYTTVIEGVKQTFLLKWYSRWGPPFFWWGRVRGRV